MAVHTVGADETGIFWTEGNVGLVRVEFVISNNGELAAGATALNVFAPRHLEYLSWCGPMGKDPKAVEASPAPSDEQLAGADGHYVETDWFSETLPRVGLRVENLRHIQFAFTLSHPLAEAEVTVPLRAKVSADEQREDVPEVVVDHLVRIRHRPRS